MDAGNKREEDREGERERREWAKIHRHRRLLVCREDEVTRTRGVEIKEEGGEKEKEKVLVFSVLPFSGSFIPASQRAVDSPKTLSARTASRHAALPLPFLSPH